MRTVKVAVDSFLSQVYCRPNVFINKSKLPAKLYDPSHSLSYFQTSVAMGSKDNGEQRWSALHVRNTFIDYFKERGHVFGMVRPATYIS